MILHEKDEILSESAGMTMTLFYPIPLGSHKTSNIEYFVLCACLMSELCRAVVKAPKQLNQGQ